MQRGQSKDWCVRVWGLMVASCEHGECSGCKNGGEFVEPLRYFPYEFEFNRR
jgi:hypothetical protein